LNKQAVVLLDSAMGTELEQRGADISMPLWSARAIISKPEIITAIHTENINAGADIITTNTFRTQRRTFEHAGYKLNGDDFSKTAKAITEKAVDLARNSTKKSGKNVLVAGGIAPIEDCYEPGLVPETDILSTEQNEHINNLVSAGVDILLAETMNTIKEISVVLNQIHRTGYEYCISFVCKNETELFSGETIKDALRIIGKFDPAVIMINCMHPELATKVLSSMKDITGFPLGVYCNIGNPGLFGQGKFEVCVSPDEYYNFAKEWKKMGVRLIGGCCGTSPEYIKKLADLKF
ncbi:MAG: homocysteine S-methyltransferase family protein, partial [Ignavibacteria bacterium]